MVNIYSCSQTSVSQSIQNKFLSSDTQSLPMDWTKIFFENARKPNGNCINQTCIQFQSTFKKLFCLNYLEYNEGVNFIQDFDEVLTRLGDIPAHEIKALFSIKKFNFNSSSY